MTYREFRMIVDSEIYISGKPKSLLKRLRVKYLQPNTNATYLARKMWYLYDRGGWRRVISKLIYLRIYHKYGCCIYPSAKVGKGFYIAHPVGIVIGDCTIGEHFTILQNSTVGVKTNDDNVRKSYPIIGNNVMLCCNSSILGNVFVGDNITIGAHSLVIKSLEKQGVYVGVPAKPTDQYKHGID